MTRPAFSIRWRVLSSRPKRRAGTKWAQQLSLPPRRGKGRGMGVVPRSVVPDLEDAGANWGPSLTVARAPPPNPPPSRGRAFVCATVPALRFGRDHGGQPNGMTGSDRAPKPPCGMSAEGGKRTLKGNSGLIALNDLPSISLPMVSLMRVLTSRIGAPLPGKLATKLVLIRSMAIILALAIQYDSVLSWLRLDALISAPGRWPVLSLLWLIAFTLFAREIAENLHRAALEEEHRQRNAFRRL